jgi:putative tricarboxylic transport membrane protein
MNIEPGNPHGSEGVVSNRTMEIVVAAILLAVGGIVVWSSVRLGWGWGAEGPTAGYFPARVGALIMLSSAVTLAVNLLRRSDGGTFVRRHQLRQVLQVLIPTALFVAAIGFIGIYVAMALFIGAFMWWQGGFPMVKIVPVAVLVPLGMFLMFEEWFLVPLPKGPLEALFGF